MSQSRTCLFEDFFSILPNGDMIHYSHREAGYISKELSPGGRIVMSTDVNATLPDVKGVLSDFWKNISQYWSPIKQIFHTPVSTMPPEAAQVPGETAEEKIKSLTQIGKEAISPLINVDTLLNRLYRIKKSDELLSKAMEEKGVESGWTIGRLEHGRYSYVDKDSGERKIFDERSMTINIIGVPMDVVYRIADLILERFNQNEVMIQDNEKNKYYLWHRGEKSSE